MGFKKRQPWCRCSQESTQHDGLGLEGPEGEEAGGDDDGGVHGRDREDAEHQGNEEAHVVGETNKKVLWCQRGRCRTFLKERLRNGRSRKCASGVSRGEKPFEGKENNKPLLGRKWSGFPWLTTVLSLRVRKKLKVGQRTNDLRNVYEWTFFPGKKRLNYGPGVESRAHLREIFNGQ